MLKDDIHKSATLILVGAYGIILLVVVSAHIKLIIMSGLGSHVEAK